MSTRVLYLGGLGRSGSTLVELLLAQSPGICALGETVHLWERGLLADERCGCGVRFSACEFWQEVGERAFGGWQAVDLAEVRALRTAVDRTRHLPGLAGSRLRPATRERVGRYTSFYTRLYRAAAQISGATVVVDSSKHASLAYALRWAEGIDLRVLHLVRDSRGVAHSWAKRVRRPEVVDGEAYMPRFSPTRVSALWTAQNVAFDALARRLPVTRLRYEDFVADPAGTLARLRELAGLPPDPAAAELFSGDRLGWQPAHTVAGNPLRFATGPLRVTADEAWRAGLPRLRRVLVGTLTLPLRRRYGYR